MLIGTVREKLHADEKLHSGIRTHAVLALVCSVGMTLGLYVFLVLFAVVGALVVVSYLSSLQSDHGLTGEVAMLAAAISLAHMSMQADSNMLHLQWGLCGVLASSVLAKSVVAWVSGGWPFCQRVGGALLLMLSSFALVLAWQTGLI